MGHELVSALSFLRLPALLASVVLRCDPLSLRWVRQVRLLRVPVLAAAFVLWAYCSVLQPLPPLGAAAVAVAVAGR